MSLASINFIIFAFIVLLIYYIFPQKIRWVWLLAASAVFYLIASGWEMLLILSLYIVINWIASIVLTKTEGIGRRLTYWCALLLDIGGLYLFKYQSFLTGTINGIGSLFGHSDIMPVFSLLSPLGLSFFALILIGYLTDVYWRGIQPQKNLAKVALFTGYFPLMTSGPIVRYTDMRDKLYSVHVFDWIRVRMGIERMVWGFFEKMVISERMAIIVNTVYGDYENYPGYYSLFAIVCFTLQLYTDFAGCMDIVIGLSEAFGIILPENFNTPFFATSLSEFWRRWHITLGTWLRYYVLNPILKSELWRRMKKKSRKRFGDKKGELPPLYLGLFLSWFIIGLWHGGSWNIIFGVGIWCWFIIVLGELLAPIGKWILDKTEIKTECFSWRLFQRIRTFVIFAVGLSFFRAESLTEGMKFWGGIFSENNPWILFDRSLFNLGLDAQDFLVGVAALFIFLIVSVLKQKMNIRETLQRQNLLFRWLVMLTLIFSILLFGLYGTGYNAQNFIYQGF